MSGSPSTEAVSAVSAVSNSPTDAYDSIQQAQNAYDLQQLETKSKESKGHSTGSVEKTWDFSAEEAHKLYENLCNACVNQCKEEQDKMKEALEELKQSTEISG